MKRVVDRARFWASMPFVAPQGLWVRRRAPTVTGASGPAHGVVGTGPDVHLLAIGDSIMAGVGAGTMDQALPGAFAKHYAARFARTVHWRAVGEIGARARDVVDRLVTLDDARAPLDVVVVSVGVNDVTGLTRTHAFATAVTHLLVHFAARAPDAVVVLAGLPPLHRFPLLPEPLRSVLGQRAWILDDTLARVAARMERVHWIETPFSAEPDDFSSDGFHPNANAVDAWAAHLVDVLAGLDPSSSGTPSSPRS